MVIGGKSKECTPTTFYRLQVVREGGRDIQILERLSKTKPLKAKSGKRDFKLA